MYLNRNCFSISVIVMTMLLVVSQTAHCKEIVGWVERASIYPGNFRIKARIDSGAKTSSLHCDCYQLINKGDEKWLSFDVTNDKGKSMHFERKLERIVKVKKHLGEVQKRMVIKLGVCLASVYKEIEVNVTDRSGMNYPMLIGRNYLAGDFLIDPGASFLNKPACGKD